MSDKEFRERMYKLGYSQEYVESVLKDRDEARKKGIVTPLEVYLVELPIED